MSLVDRSFHGTPSAIILSVNIPWTSTRSSSRMRLAAAVDKRLRGHRSLAKSKKTVVLNHGSWTTTRPEASVRGYHLERTQSVQTAVLVWDDEVRYTYYTTIWREIWGGRARRNGYEPQYPLGSTFPAYMIHFIFCFLRTGKRDRNYFWPHICLPFKHITARGLDSYQPQLTTKRLIQGPTFEWFHA